MAKRKDPINPFYLLCGASGIVFTITACAYGVLLLRANRQLPLDSSEVPDNPVMTLLDQHGYKILAVELAILAVAAFAAILLDHYRGKQQKRAQEQTKGM